MVISVEPNNEYHQCPLFDTQLPNAIWSRSKNGKFWACHNWNKWLICQIVPNCPTGISNLKSGPSPHSFVVNPNTSLFSKKRYLSNHRVCNLKYWNVMIFWAILLQVLGYFIWKCLLAATRKWGEHLTTAAASSSLGRSRGLPARFEKFVILIDIANTFLAGSKHSKTVLWNSGFCENLEAGVERRRLPPVLIMEEQLSNRKLSGSLPSYLLLPYFYIIN